MCMSGALHGSYEPVSFWYKKSTHFGTEIKPSPEVIGVTSKRRWNRNLSKLLEASVLVSSHSALVSASFGVDFQKIVIL